MLGYNLDFIHKNDKLILGKREQPIVCSMLFLKIERELHSKQERYLSILRKGEKYEEI